jgi:hypothetical protein
LKERPTCKGINLALCSLYMNKVKGRHKRDPLAKYCFRSRVDSKAAKMVYHNLKGNPVLLTIITTNTDSQSSPHQGHQVVQGLSLYTHHTSMLSSDTQP